MGKYISRLAGVVALVTILASACVGCGPSRPSGATATKTVPTEALWTPRDIDPGGAAIMPSSYTPEQFWYRMGGGGDMIATFDSLGSMVDEADLVIVGTLERFEKGPSHPVSPTQVAYFYRLSFRVSQVIKGTPISPAGAPGTVVLLALHDFSWDEHLFQVDSASAPIGDRVVLFLGNVVAYSARLSMPPGDSGPEIYVLLNGSQGWIRDTDGVAQVYRGDTEWAWVVALGGRPFQDVVDAVVAEAGKLD